MNRQPFRVPHILQRQIRTSYPTNFVFFDTETKPDKVLRGGREERHVLLFGMAIAFRYEHNRRTREQHKYFTTYEEFFEFIESRMEPKKPLYVFCHNMGFDLTIVNFWQGIGARGFNVEFAILEDPPSYVSIVKDDCKICFIDTFNYFKCSVSDLGKSVGLQKQEMPRTYKISDEFIEYCRIDVEIIARAMIALIVFMRDNELGSFALTIAGLALSTYKRRFNTVDIFIHDKVKVLELERKAYYGGIVQCFFIGEIKKEKIYKVDVNSLYPSVMLNKYPTKLIYNFDKPTMSQLTKYAKTHGVLADVFLHTTTETYPKRLDDKLCEVRGRFRTQLCGPELLKALAKNQIKHIYYLAVYEMGEIFNGYVEYFWNLRKVFKRNSDRANDTFCKYMLNSLYGKFGQRSGEWLPLNLSNLQQLYASRSKTFPICYDDESSILKFDIGNRVWFPKGLGEVVKLRSINGYVEFHTTRGEHLDSSPIVASYVTCYARERLRHLISLAKETNVYYCDTDSLFLNESGYKLLKKAGELSETELGKLKLEGVETYAAFRTCKDYAFGKDEKIKGVRKNATKLAHNKYEQLQFEGITSAVKRGGEPYVTIKKITKTVSRKYTKGTKLSTGRIYPITLNESV